jgi:hypothetical protein
MPVLIPREKRRPGRKRTVTARAWISRKDPKGAFYSHVSLGQGLVRTLATDTRDRAIALRFNHAHLLSCLKADPATASSAIEVQQEFPVFSRSA